MARNNNGNGPDHIFLATGRVIDPQTYIDDGVDVRIRGDRTLALPKTTLEGEEIVDISGMIVGPGFFPAMGARRQVNA